MAKLLAVLFCFLLCATIVHLSEFRYCEESICAVIISKCLLMQKCICQATDPFCCKKCGECLEELYVDCCGCLDLCANVCPENKGILPPEEPLSQVGNFDGIPDLFSVLTADSEDHRWKKFVLPAGKPNRTSSSLLGEKNNSKEINFDKQQNDVNVIKESGNPGKNCTVIFLNGCATRHKCVEVCESMGASGFRWFYDGCCQCIGSECSDYGIKENHCKYCPSQQEDEEELDYMEDDLWDYGAGD